MYNYFNKFPDKGGYFEKYGGNYSPDELKLPLEEIANAYLSARNTQRFINET